MTFAQAARAGWLGIRSWLWRRPEWWMLCISADCWVCLLISHAGWGHASHHAHPAPIGAWRHWSLMVGAMMFPLLIGQVRVVAGRSLWRRRNRAIVLFLSGFASPWLLYGAIAVVAMRYVPSAAALAIAALWQTTPWKQRSLRACHRTYPLAPFGWQANAACVDAGWRTGCDCLMGCWALMLPCAAGAAVVWVMPAVMAFSYSERIADRANHRRYAAVLLAAAVATAATSYH